MGKALQGLSEAPPLTPSLDRSADSIGYYLARQRKLRGIGLEELESLTRIPRRSLERLESGAFDREPDGFARGFVRTVAVAIGLDPDDTVARMLAEPSSHAARGGLPWPRRLGVLAMIVATGVGAALAAGVWAGWDSPRLEPVRAESEHRRRDAVRELAIAEGIIASSPERRGPGPIPSLEVTPKVAAPGPVTLHLRGDSGARPLGSAGVDAPH